MITVSFSGCIVWSGGHESQMLCPAQFLFDQKNHL